MSQPAERAATYEDLCRVPAHLIAQIVNGRLITQPRPGPKHVLASSSLGDELTGPFQKGRNGGPGGWWILDEPELHLAPDILVPDLAGWRRSRMPALPDTRYFEVVPDWVCEVLSPSTAQLDRVDKLAIYASRGVNHVWLINPEAQTLAVIALNQARWRLDCAFKSDDEVSGPPFEAHRFDLAALWA
jgi:Uma2 family endonuclease